MYAYGYALWPLIVPQNVHFVCVSKRDSLWITSFALRVWINLCFIVMEPCFLLTTVIPLYTAWAFSFSFSNLRASTRALAAAARSSLSCFFRSAALSLDCLSCCLTLDASPVLCTLPSDFGCMSLFSLSVTSGDIRSCMLLSLAGGAYGRAIRSYLGGLDLLGDVKTFLCCGVVPWSWKRRAPLVLASRGSGELWGRSSILPNSSTIDLALFVDLTDLLEVENSCGVCPSVCPRPGEASGVVLDVVWCSVLRSRGRRGEPDTKG